MSERSYGARYGVMGGKWTSAADIAKLMRADIKAAVTAGDLPGAAANYSVRVHNYSGGRSINIQARDLPDMWADCDGSCRDPWCAAKGLPDYAHASHTHRALTPEGRRVEDILKAVHRAYNHDGSDVMTDYFDVNYYGDASVEDERRARWRAEETARKAAAKARKAAGS